MKNHDFKHTFKLRLIDFISYCVSDSDLYYKSHVWISAENVGRFENVDAVSIRRANITRFKYEENCYFYDLLLKTACYIYIPRITGWDNGISCTRCEAHWILSIENLSFKIKILSTFCELLLSVCASNKCRGIDSQ